MMTSSATVVMLKSSATRAFETGGGTAPPEGSTVVCTTLRMRERCIAKSTLVKKPLPLKSRLKKSKVVKNLLQKAVRPRQRVGLSQGPKTPLS